jgi:hypothetical protein
MREWSAAELDLNPVVDLGTIEHLRKPTELAAATPFSSGHKPTQVTSRNVASSVTLPLTIYSYPV